VLFPEALYNLETDPTESNDVRAKHPEIVSALKVLADEARKELGDDLQKIPGSGRRGPGELTK
jgi:arylsulfatase